MDHPSQAALRDSHAGKRRPILLSAAEVAILLGCSARHVQRLARRGGLPRPVELGALRRWSADEIDRWIEDRGGRGSSTEEAP